MPNAATRENLAAEARREERQEERRREEQRVEGERRREEQRAEEERRRQEEERHRQEEERRRQEEERRHMEMMTLLAAVLNNGGNHGNGQNELIRTLQQTVEDLRAENDRLRRQNGNSGQSSDSS